MFTNLSVKDGKLITFFWYKGSTLVIEQSFKGKFLNEMLING